MNHIQCKLQKGNIFQTAWIPEQYAKKNKYLTIKRDQGWIVIETYSKMLSKEVQKRSIDYRNQRKVSDI